MDVIVKLTVSGKVYQFYQDAARHIAESSPEDIMSDALCGYAQLISQNLAREHQDALASDEDSE